MLCEKSSFESERKRSLGLRARSSLVWPSPLEWITRQSIGLGQSFQCVYSIPVGNLLFGPGKCHSLGLCFGPTEATFYNARNKVQGTRWTVMTASNYHAVLHLLTSSHGAIFSPPPTTEADDSVHLEQETSVQMNFLTC